jgi:hypothetical protein
MCVFIICLKMYELGIPQVPQPTDVLCEKGVKDQQLEKCFGDTIYT